MINKKLNMTNRRGCLKIENLNRKGHKGLRKERKELNIFIQTLCPLHYLSVLCG